MGLVLQFSLKQSAGVVIGTSSPTNHRRLVYVSDFFLCVDWQGSQAQNRGIDSEPENARVETKQLR